MIGSNICFKLTSIDNVGFDVMDVDVIEVFGINVVGLDVVDFNVIDSKRRWLRCRMLSAE
jgi:hypothetical protein